MIVFFLIWLLLLIPNVAFAAKPEDPAIRVGAIIVMVFLVAVIAAAWRMINSMLAKRNAKSTHKAQRSQQPAPDYSRLAPKHGSTVHKPPERIETTPVYRKNDSRSQVSRSSLSLDEAVLGHWVSYIDFRTSYEKLMRSKHYVATHWYFDENNLKIIQMEIKGTEEVPKATNTFVYKILERNHKENMIRIEMFDDPEKLSYSQATFKFSHDRRKMVQETVLPKISLSPSEWFYVDSVKTSD